jgi:hypothetical protein
MSITFFYDNGCVRRSEFLKLDVVYGLMTFQNTGLFQAYRFYDNTIAAMTGLLL